jgi:septum formation protein
MPHIILASSSPQRRRLLDEAGYEFEVMEPDDREPDPRLFDSPTAYVAHAAWLKAQQIATRVNSGLVLAADTVVALGSQIIGKPIDRDDARRILRQLSGSVHQCLTGICLWSCPENYWTGAVDSTDLRMRELTSDELEDYLASNRWVGKAGAYAIQEPDPYVATIRGSHSNVVGLPMEFIDRLMRTASRHERTE